MPLRLDRFYTHTPYTGQDFTPREIMDHNLLALAVIQDKREICKHCGKSDDELYNSRCK